VAANVKVVEFTYVVARGLPFTLTTEAVTNVLPVTVIVAGDVPPIGSAGGFSVSTPTDGLFTASEAAADVPPPGVGFAAVNARLPVADTSAAVSVTLTCVELL
jgi:hypothetical protein